jgi:hypothetical protein
MGRGLTPINEQRSLYFERIWESWRVRSRPSSLLLVSESSVSSEEVVDVGFWVGNLDMRFSREEI